jgi:hypothetical protein
MKNLELNKKYSLDMGSSPVEVLTKEFLPKGVICEYLSSWSGRVEIVDYEIFKMNGYEQLENIEITNK